MHNLVNEVAWVPVTDMTGAPAELTLAQVVERSNELSFLAGQNPVEMAATMRLLCAAAIASGAATGADLDIDRLGSYLGEWSHRFDMADSAEPFMQTHAPGLEPGPVAALNPARTAGGDHTWFDWRATPDIAPIDAASAARQLVAMQAAGTGGLQRGPKPSTVPSLSGPKGTLARNVAVFVVGPTLAASIAANCAGVEHPEADRPYWERPHQGLRGGKRHPDGSCDWLTWQPKRIMLTVDGAGRYDGCAIWPGDTPPKAVADDPRQIDPHVVTRVLTKTTTGPAGSNFASPTRLQRLLETGADDVDGLRAHGALDSWARSHPGAPVKAWAALRCTNQASYTGDRGFWLDLTNPNVTDPQNNAAPGEQLALF
jgi:CRISPR type I-E-associated protein CasA/Cse1